MNIHIAISTGWALFIAGLLVADIVADVVLIRLNRECNRLRATIIKARGYE